MPVDQGLWLTDLIREFVKTSPENKLRQGSDEKAWEDALVGFASGADPLFEEYKNLVGPLHWTPLEIFRLTFPQINVTAEELTVISWILPQRKATRMDNRKEKFYPSRRWFEARLEGEHFNEKLRRHVVAELERRGVRSVAPSIAPEWSWEKSEKYVLTSKWSERHAAYAAGLGTFGLCDGLITSKGKAHRAGSVVANVSIIPTLRPYDDHHAYCLFFQDGSCTACVRRCPVGAITERGHDKTKCREHVLATCAEYVKEKYRVQAYACGLCQTGVPCESHTPKRPKTRRKSTGSNPQM